MTVQEFLDLCIEGSALEVTIYDFCEQDNVFVGRAEDIPDEYMDCTVCSFDPPMRINDITLNVESSGY